MAEYIEREAIMQAFADHVWNSNHSDLVPAPQWNHAVDIVRDIPAADMVEVSSIHDAVYEAMQALNSIYFAKRIGNADYMDLMGAISLILYNCGAKMDGGADDDQR